jgi:hypothetical protein
LDWFVDTYGVIEARVLEQDLTSLKSRLETARSVEKQLHAALVPAAAPLKLLQQKGGLQSVARRRADLGVFVQSIELLRKGNARLSDAAAVRRYLENADTSWHVDTDNERTKKVFSALRRLRRGRQKIRTRSS